MRLRWISGLVMCVCLLVASVARAEEVTIGASSFPPYLVIDKDGTVTGPALEFFRRLGEKSGLTFKFVPMDVKGAVLALVANQIDLYPYPLIPELADKVVIGPKLATVGVSVAWLKGTAPVTGINDLAGKNLAVISGYSYVGLRDRVAALQPAPFIVEARDFDSALPLLSIRRAKYLLAYTEPLHVAQQATPVPLDIQELPLASVDFQLLSGKLNPRAEDLLKRVSDAYAAMPEKDRLHAQ